MNRSEILPALGAVIIVNAIGAAPAFVFGADTTWFEEPWFYPPEVAFPIVWTILFTVIGIALYLIWRNGIQQRPVQVAIGLFAIQMLINLAWTPVFFGLQRPVAALGVIGLLWLAIVATIWAASRVSRFAALLLIPYLGWVTFAAILNAAIAFG